MPRRLLARRARSWFLAGLALAGLLVFLWLVLAVVPPLLLNTGGTTPAERLKAENDLRTTLVQVLAGLALLGGLVFTGLNFRTNREGQITERFTRAVDQLGSDKLDVRLGGIYAWSASPGTRTPTTRRWWRSSRHFCASTRARARGPSRGPCLCRRTRGRRPPITRRRLP